MSGETLQFASSFIIRPPHGSERMAWRMLLTELSGPTQQPLVRVAVEDAPSGRIVGAAAMGLDPALRVQRGLPFDMHVIPPCRRQGLGRRLVETLAEEAVSHHVEAAFSWPWFAYDEGNEAFCIGVWRRLGFEPWQREFTYEVDVQRAIEGVEPLYRRIRDRGRIPPDAQVVPLRDAPTDDVVDLHVRQLGGRPAAVRALIDGTDARSVDPDISLVALRGDKVVGLSLTRINYDAGRADFDSLAIDPAERGRWVLPWLRYQGFALGWSKGIHTARYFALEQHTDTRAAGERMGAILLRTRVRLRRSFTTATFAAAARGPS